LDLHVSFDSKRDLTGQVYRQIRAAVVEGRLRGGETLPSTRELARRLEVSRNTVGVAYERLRAEGFLTSRVGAGTFVSDGIRTHPANGAPASPLRARSLWACFPEPPDMSASGAAFDFRMGVPDAARFPYAPWRARVTRQLRALRVGTGAHIGAAGHPALRAAIARHVAVSRAVRAVQDDVLVTNGSQQAIDLIARVLLEPGEVVAVEDPGYPPPRRAFVAHGCEVVGVPVDDEGIVVDAIPREARLVYVTPSHQFPLGMAMSMGRRQALLRWADEAGAAIIEDDYDSEFRYGGRPLETLQSLDRTGRVLYVGTLSKVMLPTLRLGFAVAPAPLHAALRRAKYVADWHTAVPVQAAAAEFIDDGLLAEHIRRMRRVYAERHDLITRTLRRDFADHLSPIASAGGLHLAAPFHGGEAHRDEEVVRRARKAGVAVMALSRYAVGGAPPRPGLLIGYGAIATDRIGEGLRRLRACIA
jgi:GntR family transcriptional regulator/MocR family aminotransferase